MSSTVDPAGALRIVATSASPLAIVRPSTLVIVSPSASPALAAALPDCTFCSVAPPPSASVAEAPRNARVAWPSLMSWFAMRMAWSTGIAKPRPIEPVSWPLLPSDAPAEFIPTSSPRRFTSGPPELPGLIAVSVWMAFITDVVVPSPAVLTGRSTALTIPSVTVPASASGDPQRDDGLPDLEVGGATDLDRGQARDAVRLDDGDVVARVAADRLAVALLPSLNSTVSAPPEAAPATTWLFVRM